MSDLDGYNDRDLVEELENRGYTVDEINLDKITLNYGDRDQILNLIDVSSPKKPIIGAECNIRAKTGQKIVINKNIDFLHYEGEVLGGIETFIDITFQKEQEEKLRLHSEQLEETIESRTAALQEERSRLRSILDGMTDMAYIVTADLRIDFFNKA